MALKCCSSEEYKNVAEFYGDILGLSVARKWDGGIMFDTGDGIIEVFEDGESPLPQGNIRHFEEYVSYLDRWKKKKQRSSFNGLSCRTTAYL